MATPRKAGARPHARFVDALRECLGLDPLYGDPRNKLSDVQRFARLPYPGGDADLHGNRRIVAMHHHGR